MSDFRSQILEPTAQVTQCRKVLLQFLKETCDVYHVTSLQSLLIAGEAAPSPTPPPGGAPPWHDIIFVEIVEILWKLWKSKTVDLSTLFWNFLRKRAPGTGPNNFRFPLSNWILWRKINALSKTKSALIYFVVIVALISESLLIGEISTDFTTDLAEIWI